MERSLPQTPKVPGGGGGGACDQQRMTSVGVSRGKYVTGRMVMVAGAAGQGNKGIRLH